MAKNIQNISHLVLALTAVSTFATPADAQTAAESAAPQAPVQDNATDKGPLEDIVITAQRREERLQDVPVSVTAITASSLAARGISVTDNLPQVTPALNIGRQGNIPLVFLRGVGTQNASSGEEISVPLYIDGVYVLGQTNTLFALNNISRIEVLRGPQGTLFGRNATGGLIQIVTRDPKATTTADFTVAVENYKTVIGQGYLSTGLTKDLAVDLSVYYRNRSEGFGTNRATNTEVGLTNDFAIRSKLLWTPGSTTRISLAGDYTKSRSDVGTVRQLTPGTIGVDRRTTFLGRHDISTSFNPSGGAYRASGTLQIEQDIADSVRLLSITAYQDSTNFFKLDLDATPANVLRGDTDEGRNGFTQEVQLQSMGPSRFQWVAGVFYLDSHAYVDPQIVSGPGLAALQFQRRSGVIDTKSYAGFVQGTYELSDATRVTVGARYTKDEKSSRLTQTTALNSVTVNGTANASRLTYRVALDHKFSDDVMAYGVVSRGFKSGGFNLNNIANPIIRPETLQSYEGGIKSELLDRRVRLNVSGFYYDYKDIQLSQNQGPQTLVLNAAKARIYGLEAELQAELVARFSVSGGMSLQKGEYTSFPNAPATFPEPYTCALNGPGPGDPPVGNQNCTIDASGNTTLRTPKFSFNLSATYTAPLADGSLSLSGSLYHTDQFFYEADNRLREPSYEVVNATVGWTDPSERLTLSVYARNILDQQYNILISSSVSDQLEQADPRTYGASLRYRF